MLVWSVPVISAGITVAYSLFSRYVFRHGKRFPEL
jgi:hypothetical protein